VQLARRLGVALSEREQNGRVGELQKKLIRTQMEFAMPVLVMHLSWNHYWQLQLGKVDWLLSHWSICERDTYSARRKAGRS
jgi:hypothetical protein